MNRTITLRELSAEIAAATSITDQDAEAFLRELASVVTEGLAAGESVRIKGIGTFAADGDTVMFKPDDELAEAVNMPFAAFEPVELDDSLTDDMLSEPFTPEPEPPEEPQHENQEETADEEVPTDNEPAKEEEEEEPQQQLPEPVTETEQEPEKEKEAETETCAESAEEPAEECDTDPQTTATPRRSRCGLLWFFAIVACAGCFMAGYYFGYRHGLGTATCPDPYTPAYEPVDAVDDTASIDTPDTITAPVTPDSTIAKIPAEPAVITDTIRRGRFLTTMARQYYGRMEFWVYIYEENSASLGDPDRISSGTTVVIPPAGKYGIDPSDPESIRRAELKSKEIYAPYKK